MSSPEIILPPPISHSTLTSSSGVFASSHCDFSASPDKSSHTLTRNDFASACHTSVDISSSIFPLLMSITGLSISIFTSNVAVADGLSESTA